MSHHENTYSNKAFRHDVPQSHEGSNTSARRGHASESCRTLQARLDNNVRTAEQVQQLGPAALALWSGLVSTADPKLVSFLFDFHTSRNQAAGSTGRVTGTPADRRSLSLLRSRTKPVDPRFQRPCRERRAPAAKPDRNCCAHQCQAGSQRGWTTFCTT